jgi:uncharacterized protein (DUF1501 family)
MFNRRQFLSTAALSAGAMLINPRLAMARVDSDRRFVFVIQRGAADGLNIVVPYGDPSYARLRGELAIDAGAAPHLDGTFALHPSLVRTAAMYQGGDALMVHAIASPYRDRSHFDGQNVLETGGLTPYQMSDGWLNRLVGLLPKRGNNAIAFAPTVPMALRGHAEVTSYAPSSLPEAPDDLLVRVTQLYAGDPQLHALWSAAQDARGLAANAGARQDPASLGKLAASFLVRPDGPRIAMIETQGWDTHSAQNPRLANTLKSLDAMLGALHDGMGSEWANTTVVVATEFGRTAAANGTGGTDHGTGSAALVLGGGLKGGRVVADWPGLSQANLFEARDLKATLALDTLISNLAAESFGLDPVQVGRALFPRAPVAQNSRLQGLLKV